MGASKTDHYTTYQIQLARLAKALGHPARVAILEFLLKTNACICGDIVKELNLAQPTVSQHLKELKEAGMIQGETEGNAICYCINNDTLLILRNAVNGIFEAQKKKINCC